LIYSLATQEEIKIKTLKKAPISFKDKSNLSTLSEFSKQKVRPIDTIVLTSVNYVKLILLTERRMSFRELTKVVVN